MGPLGGPALQRWQQEQQPSNTAVMVQQHHTVSKQSTQWSRMQQRLSPCLAQEHRKRQHRQQYQLKRCVYAAEQHGELHRASSFSSSSSGPTNLQQLWRYIHHKQMHLGAVHSEPRISAPCFTYPCVASGSCPELLYCLPNCLVLVPFCFLSCSKSRRRMLTTGTGAAGPPCLQNQQAVTAATGSPVGRQQDRQRAASSSSSHGSNSSKQQRSSNGSSSRRCHR